MYYNIMDSKYSGRIALKNKEVKRIITQHQVKIYIGKDIFDWVNSLEESTFLYIDEDYLKEVYIRCEHEILPKCEANPKLDYISLCLNENFRGNSISIDNSFEGYDSYIKYYDYIKDAFGALQDAYDNDVIGEIPDDSWTIFGSSTPRAKKE